MVGVVLLQRGGCLKRLGVYNLYDIKIPNELPDVTRDVPLRRHVITHAMGVPTNLGVLELRGRVAVGWKRCVWVRGTMWRRKVGFGG
jgi:hypothetical protein